MKISSIIVFLSVICAITGAKAQQYTPVEQGSVIKFKVGHTMVFKSTVTGTFKGLKGTILFDPKNLAQASFNVSVDVQTISSGIGMRDNDLKKEKYFDVSKYPVILIKSENISKGPQEGSYVFSGTLTMKGVTKNISFPFYAKPSNDGYQFQGSFQLNRLDYNLGPENSIDKNVEIDLTVSAR
jgi:polyisoprenoid-binding protein YceI